MRWIVLLAILSVVLIASSAGMTSGSIIDLESSSDDTFGAWISTLWTQTSQVDFDAGVLSQVDTSSSPDDVKLELASGSEYFISDNMTAQILDTGVAGTGWDALFWDETLPSNTDITFEVRASDTIFLKDADTPSWTSVGGTSPVTSGLPSGRYMQWRATLTTTDTSKTPYLQEVRVYYH